MEVLLNQSRISVPRLTVRSFLRAALAGSCLALTVAAVLPSAVGQATPTPQKPTNQAEPKPNSYLRPEANRLPDANDIMLMREQQGSKAKFEAANIERKRQLDEDSLALLKLAAEVNDYLGKNAQAPSQETMKKIEEIERLAHNVQIKMKLTMSAPN